MSALRLEPCPPAELAGWSALLADRRRRLLLLPLLADERLSRRRADAIVAGLAQGDGRSELLRVMDADRPVGWVWLRPGDGSGAEPCLLDADAEVPPEALLDLLVERTAGASHLHVERMAGAATPAALARAGDFAPSSTLMVLRLDEVPATSQRPQVRLVAMPEDRFAGWREESIEGYALDMETSTTLDHEQSVARSRAEFADLLPAGLATPDHHLFDVRADEATVGTLWLARRSPRAFFVYDVVIDAAARGRGLGRAAMDAAARWCRDRGADVLGLNVFGQNQVARRLYDSLGYRVVLEELTLRLR